MAARFSSPRSAVWNWGCWVFAPGTAREKWDATGENGGLGGVGAGLAMEITEEFKTTGQTSSGVDLIDLEITTMTRIPEFFLNSISQYRIFRTTALLIVGVLVSMLPANAESAAVVESSVTAALSESIDVRVINVEAVVTDKKGVRIHGLGAEDFRILVDGEEVPVGYFSEIRGGQALAAETQGGQGFVASAPAVVAGEPLGTSYLIFIDEFFTVSNDRRTVLRALRDDLGRLGLNDRVAVVAWDGKGLEMLTSWTGSIERAQDVLDRALDRPSYGLQRVLEERQYLLGRGSAALRARRSFGPGAYQLGLDERIYADLIVDQVERAAQAAAATLRGFAAPPGRRVMLLLSGSWPYDPAQYVAGSRFRLVLESTIERGDEIYGPLEETANLLGYTLYPVDVPGIEGSTGAEASARSTLDARLLREASFNREDETHYTFYQLARKTGGRALLNGKRTSAFAEVVEDTRSFYWLGFTPNWAGDNEEHEIVVEVDRPDLKVRNRDSFSDLSQSMQLAMAVESAVLFGNPVSLNPLEIQVGRAKKAGWGKVEVPLTITIPVDQLTVLKDAAGYRADLEIHLAVLDERGSTADIAPIPFVFNSEQAPVEGDEVVFKTTLKMRRADHDLVVAVYDRTGGNMLSAAAELGL